MRSKCALGPRSLPGYHPDRGTATGRWPFACPLVWRPSRHKCSTIGSQSGMQRRQKRCVCVCVLSTTTITKKTKWTPAVCLADIWLHQRLLQGQSNQRANTHEHTHTHTAFAVWWPLSMCACVKCAPFFSGGFADVMCACGSKLAINLIAALIVTRVQADLLAQVLFACRRVQAETPIEPFIPYLFGRHGGWLGFGKRGG